VGSCRDADGEDGRRREKKKVGIVSLADGGVADVADSRMCEFIG